MKQDYISKDLSGYAFNAKYPPDNERYGNRFGGYSNDTRETLFHYFAVLGYDLEFHYNGKAYYCLSEPDYVALCDSQFNIEYQRFADANAFIEQFELEGKRLIDIIDELENVESW